MTEQDNSWIEIYELESWIQQAREMILEKQHRIDQLKREYLNNQNNKETE